MRGLAKVKDDVDWLPEGNWPEHIPALLHNNTSTVILTWKRGTYYTYVPGQHCNEIFCAFLVCRKYRGDRDTGCEAFSESQTIGAISHYQV